MKTLSLATAAAVALLSVFAACSTGATSEIPTAEAQTPAEAEITTADRVKRGEYLVSVIGCDDCHTPKIFSDKGMELDMERRLSGHPAGDPVPTPPKELITEQQALVWTAGLTAAIGPWGTSFAANLTPDDTGTGAWTEAQFIKAIREGKSKGLDGARPLLPPMPWFVYKNMTDEDLKSIFAYLQTVKPVKNVVPTPVPPL